MPHRIAARRSHPQAAGAPARAQLPAGSRALRAHRGRGARLHRRGGLRVAHRPVGDGVPQPADGGRPRGLGQLPGAHPKAAWWWAWKQTLPGRKACYYAKILRGRGTFISWRYFPYFDAAYSTGRDIEDDYRLGLVPRADKRVMDSSVRARPHGHACRCGWLTRRPRARTRANWRPRWRGCRRLSHLLRRRVAARAGRCIAGRWWSGGCRSAPGARRSPQARAGDGRDRAALSAHGGRGHARGHRVAVPLGARAQVQRVTRACGPQAA